MTSAGFEPAIPSSERPQTHALDRAPAGICAVAFNGNVVKKADNRIFFYSSYRHLQPVSLYLSCLFTKLIFLGYFRLLVKIRMLNASASDSMYTE